MVGLLKDVPVIVSCCSPLERVPLALVDRDARLRERWCIGAILRGES